MQAAGCDQQDDAKGDDCIGEIQHRHLRLSVFLSKERHILKKRAWEETDSLVLYDVSIGSCFQQAVKCCNPLYTC